MFGAKDTYTEKFGHIGGLYSFITTVRKLIKEHRINKVVLAWDHEQGGYYRHLIEPNYKSNRKNKKWYETIELSEAEIKREQYKEQSELKQRKRIQQYAEELFLRQIEVDKIEADDLIAAYCMQYAENEDIHLYTNDRDFAQLLEYDITILFDNKDEPTTKMNFMFQFGYSYKNALTVKIICGDTSDNLKGVDGLKETSLLKYFPDLKFKPCSVRDIYEGAYYMNKERTENKKKPLKALDNLINSKEILKTNHKLMNLSEPFLTEEAEEELKDLELPLSDEDRGAKNLYNLMIEDDFLSVWGGRFKDYVEPFYPVVSTEKDFLKQYLHS
jgi:5'-3' exonuclease